ncbi:hypothetical protein A5724_28890 [Mycobacterium sp. ACS1612]|uniref:hypothetical protein n=1 Tax=Mycobacterium sp. ACS1612 TaxID=1834117 RepID=UPI0007FE2E29|nr:hypothetical protein [Mycobacterium sp. ACS1612]OBF28412.1 hypothetical protein A5724_28890 [Mycobacterium sp. ACS1612]
MPGKHRTSESCTKRIAVVGVATATATALTVGAAPPPPKPAPAPVVAKHDVDLAAAFRPFTDPNQIPDLTFGLGTAAYNFSQTVADTVLRAIVNNLNFAVLARAAGLDPNSILEGLLGSTLDQLPGNLLQDVLNVIPILPGDLAEALVNGLGLPDATAVLLEPLLATALSALGIDSVGDLLTQLVGLDLGDVLNLGNLDLPGVNIVTAGPPFTLLKLLGADLGWVPGLPNSVANDINNSKYLQVGVVSLLQEVLDRTNIPALEALLNPLLETLPDIDAIDVRIPVTVGFGLGAFAAGAAYDKVVADLRNQPGGAAYTGDPSLLGSLTVLPMVLLRNPGRANGGLFARFFPLAGLLGIDTVTPETQATHSGGIPLLNTGLSLGGANLLPVKVDGTVEYDIMSDFAAWPNPFSIANSVVGAVLPTYLLRGFDLSNVSPQLAEQIQAAIQRTTDLNEPLALNLYLTLPSNTLPMLEPLYLLADAVNLTPLGAFPNPFERLANALAPALTSLTNLGYTDVVRNPDGTYTRTLDEAGVPTPFMSFPDVNWGQVPGDVITSLIKGFQKEFLSGHPTPGTPNAITGLLKLLSGVLGPLGGLGDIINGLPGLITDAITPVAANAVTTADTKKMITLSTDPSADEVNGRHAAPAGTPVPDDTGATPKHAADETEPPTEESTAVTTPENSKPDDESTTTKPKPKAPRNPVGDIVGGATHTVAGVVGGATHEVATGVAGVLKSLAPKKTTKPKADKTDKTDTEKDSAAGGAGGAPKTAAKPAA